MDPLSAIALILWVALGLILAYRVHKSFDQTDRCVCGHPRSEHHRADEACMFRHASVEWASCICPKYEAGR